MTGSGKTHQNAFIFYISILRKLYISIKNDSRVFLILIFSIISTFNFIKNKLIVLKMSQHGGAINIVYFATENLPKLN